MSEWIMPTLMLLFLTLNALPKILPLLSDNMAHRAVMIERAKHFRRPPGRRHTSCIMPSAAPATAPQNGRKGSKALRT